MCRIILGIALLLAAAGALAQEDEDLLEVEPLGPPIPERLESLEREWDREVGGAAPKAEEDDLPGEADADRPVAEKTETEDDEAPDGHDAVAPEDAAGKKRAAARPMKSRKGATDEAAEVPMGTPLSTPPKPADPEAD